MSTENKHIYHAVVDFESLSTSDDGLILSGAIIVFDFKTGQIMEEKYYEFDHVSQMMAGRTIDKRTTDWWRNENAGEMYRLLREGKVSLETFTLAVKELGIHYDIKKYWSRGYMDFGMMLNIGCPLKYYHFADVRTLDVFGKKMDKANHNALSDCHDELKYIMEVMNGYQNMQ